MQKLKFIKIIYWIFVFCICYVPSFSQQGNIWYFGENAGLDFNTTPPTALTNGQLITAEGCSSISDKTGSLLFYTDGKTVYDRNHSIMLNGSGLMGHPSSTNSSVIVPLPGSYTVYYVFTADASPGNAGYHFSVVDMKLNNGLGAVTNQKNILLYAPCTERLTAVKHANGKDFWVITKQYQTNAFFSYKIDCSGINTMAVVSNTGFTPTQLYEGIGAIKASPNGKKLCIAIAGNAAMAQLFDFDNINGTLSNPIDLPGYNAPNGIYGVEFSPDSKQLYISANLKTIKQYDITSNNATAINASMYIITTIDGDYNLGLQLGPDKKIYVATSGKSSLNIISNPNVHGAGCNLVLAGIDLNGRRCFFGLPSYISSFFDSNNHIDFTHTYSSCKINFSASTDLSGSLTWLWNFGDGTSGSAQSVSHSYTIPGNYTVILKGIPNGACTINDTFYANHAVIANPLPIAFAGKDTTVNFNTLLQLQASGGTSYIWSPFTGLNNAFIANPVALITNDIAYIVTITDDNGCVTTDDILIKVTGGVDVFIPNSFTPNGDRKNDNIKPLGRSLKEIEYFKIFNRYGELVFKTKAIGEGWDGIFKGTQQPAGAYTFILKATSYDNKPVEKIGTFLLLR